MDGIARSTETPVVIVERYWPRVTVEALRGTWPAHRVDGLSILGSIVVPADELVLSVFLGQADAVAEAHRRERLPFIRILPATLLAP
jgi:hypothetical protein